MKYIDSNIFIYAILGAEPKIASAAKKILTEIAEGSLPAATSSLTWDEVVWIIKKVLGRIVATEEGKKFLEFPNLKILSVDEHTLYAAQKIIDKCNVDPRDAIHLACCAENNIEQIISDDPDLDKFDGVTRVKLK